MERANQTLKMVLTKLVIETKKNWLKCLPLALLRMRMRPRTDIGVSAYEAMFGLPSLTVNRDKSGTYEEGQYDTQQYIQTIARTLEGLRKRGSHPQSTPIDFKIHTFQPGDWVLIKVWNEKPLTVQWEGPFEVLLTTETAERTRERGWSHITRVKGPVPAPTKWKVVRQADTKLTLRKEVPH